MAAFERYIGVDYSGAASPDSRRRGLRVYVAEGEAPSLEIRPDALSRKNWTRREVALWLVAQLADSPPSVVGIDHGFSFPTKYFEAHKLRVEWDAFLDDFQKHWPTDEKSVQSVRHIADLGAARSGEATWKRLTETRANGAKSVFHFDVPGSVAKSTHAGLPWLCLIRQRHPNVHFWPFDGWDIPEGLSAIAEVYPSLWNKKRDRPDMTPDQYDAHCIAVELRKSDRNGELAGYLNPSLNDEERKQAEIEGWILGVG